MKDEEEEPKAGKDNGLEGDEEDQDSGVFLLLLIVAGVWVVMKLAGV
jgi:hypothetical protein